MLEVKIPSPPIAKIKSHVDDNNLDMANAIRGYMATLLNSIQFISKADFSYQGGRVADDGIYATININQLPEYHKVANLYSNINFEQAMIAQISTGNKHYGNDCPIANKDNLRQPIHTWSVRWITIYLWTMLRADFSMRFLASPKQLVNNNTLMDELIAGLGGSPNPQEKLPPKKQEQSNTTDNESDAKPINKQPEQAPVATERVVTGSLDPTLASQIAVDCIGIQALFNIIKKSNDRSVELHCMAQGMDFSQVVAEREVINQETIKELSEKIGGLLQVINDNPDFFEDPKRFKVIPAKQSRPDPIEESDPL